MEIKSKIWLEAKEGLVFGTGKSVLLKAVNETGSINKAAKQLNMSYRHAWSYLKSMEKRLGENILLKSKGGKNGGGTHLTKYAKELIRKFDILEQKTIKFVNGQFKKIYG